MDHMLVFQLGWWPFDYLNGCLRFTCDGEGGMTSCRRFGVSSVPTVRGRQVDGHTTVIAEAFEVATFSCLLGELAIHPNTRVGATGCRCIG